MSQSTAFPVSRLIFSTESSPSLAEYRCSVAHCVRTDRTTPIGQMINSYLQQSSELEDRAIHLLFAANRWEAAYV